MARWMTSTLLLLLLLNGSEGVRIRHHRHHHIKNIMADGESDNYQGPFVLMTLSEINMDSDTAPPKRFIELLATRVTGYEPQPHESLFRGWRLLMIRGSNLEIVMSIDISRHLKSSEDPYIVVGESTVPNTAITFSNIKTETAFKTSTFPDLDTSPYCIIVARTMDEDSSEVLSLEQLNGSYQPLSISNDEYRKKIISDVAWDAVVIGRRVPTNQCDFFNELFPTQAYNEDFRYILRDWDAPTSSIRDYSLNYCCDSTMQFKPSCFKLGHPSPGLDNDCSGNRFILEFEMNQIAASRQSGLFIDQNDAFCKANFPGVEPYRYNTIHDHDYSMAVARVMRRPECERPIEYMDIDEPPESNVPFNAISPDLPEAPKKYLSEFDEAEFAKCRQHFSKPDDLLQTRFKAWLQVKHEPNRCLIYCRVCRTYFQSGWRPDRKHRQNLQKDGYFSNDKYKNQEKVTDHVKDPIHAEAGFFFTRLDSASTRFEQLLIEADQNSREKERLRPTMNVIGIGYMQFQARVSFRSNPIFLNGISSLGVDIGFKFRNPKFLHTLSTVLSSCFHKRLLEQLVREQKYFSLICDGTTNKNVPYLACLMQTLEDSRPIVYFWGLVVITTGETGYNMVEDIKIRVAEDNKQVPGFKDYFKSHIIASVSDSASNMAGSTNSFYAYLSHFVGRNLALVKCGAHKLQRAIIHAIDFATDDPSPLVAEKERKRYFKSFAGINNKFYSFYMSRGSKRFQEFVELAEELEIPAYRINYFFDVRWAASHKRCMETMYKNYDALRADLNHITNDAQFDKTGKAKAAELYKHLIDKTFPVVVAEFVDFLTVFSIMSQRFQSKGGIMLGNVEIIRDGYVDIEKLKNEPGSYLQNFLSKCSCIDLCSKETTNCTLTDYDNCPEILKEAVPVPHKLVSRTDGQHTIKLSSFRSVLYTNLQNQLTIYFEPEKLEAFEIFNPKNFLASCSGTALNCEDLASCYTALPTIVPDATPKTPEDNMRTICTFYGISDCNKVITDWKSTLSTIVSDHRSQKIRNVDPAKYWPNQMIMNPSIFSTEIKGLLERVLVTSFTSADAERAFSMVTNIKTHDRQSLAPKTLENLVRIAFNGPDRLSEESLFEYTKEFVKVSSRVDDATVKGGREPKEDAYKKFFSKSKIF